MRRAIGGSSPWLGLQVQFYFLALIKVAEPLFLLRVPRSLWAIRPWESELYRRLLVPNFGRLLRRTPLRFLNLAVYLAGEAPDLARVLRLSEAAEAAHATAALLFAPYLGWVWWAERPWEALVLLAVQVAFNLYPTLHLRLVRGRLQRVLERRQAPH